MRDAANRRARRPRVPRRGRPSSRSLDHLLELTGVEQPAGLPAADGERRPAGGDHDFYSVARPLRLRADPRLALPAGARAGGPAPPPARAGSDLRRRRLDAEPDRDLAGARACRVLARGLAPRARSSRARAPARCAGSSTGSRASAGSAAAGRRPRPPAGQPLASTTGATPRAARPARRGRERASPRAMGSTTAPGSCSRAPSRSSVRRAPRRPGRPGRARTATGAREMEIRPIPLRPELARLIPRSRTPRAAADEAAAPLADRCLRAHVRSRAWPCRSSPRSSPQLALSRKALPEGEGWAYEPKWDGFRALAFVDGDEVYLQSRGGKPAAALLPRARLPAGRVRARRRAGDPRSRRQRGVRRAPEPDPPGRVADQMLAEQTPAIFRAFDLLAVGGKKALSSPFTEECHDPCNGNAQQGVDGAAGRGIDEPRRSRRRCEFSHRPHSPSESRDPVLPSQAGVGAPARLSISADSRASCCHSL